MATVVRAALLIDGTGRPPVPEPSVVIEAGRISLVVAGAAPELSETSEVIDVGEATLMPGLIDCHEHLGPRQDLGYWRAQMEDPDHEIAFRMAKSAFENIRAGVTSVRNLGDKNYLDLAARKSIDRGFIPGPRVYPSGAAIRPSHGHGAVATTVADGVDGVRKAVREAIAKGVHHIKIFITGGVGTLGTDPRTTYYTEEEIRTAVEEAHRMGRKVAGHCYGGIGADWAIAAGLDSIEHGTYLTEDQLKRMAGSGTWLVPTVCAYYDERYNLEVQPKEVVEKAREARAKCEMMLQSALRAGVRIAAGCDARHGEVWTEVNWLHRLGMPAMQAIGAATRDAAELLGESQQIGTIEAGKLADLIAVDGNPVVNPAALQKVVLVLRQGLRYV